MSSSSSWASVARRAAVVEGRSLSGFTSVNATARPTGHPSASERVVGDVRAPDVAQRVGDLAACGACGQGLLHGQEHVVGAFGGGAQGVQRTRYGVVVAFLAQHREALALVVLDPGVDAH